MPSLPLIPFVALFLLLLPVKVTPANLIRLAFFLWALGGLMLIVLGVARLFDPSVGLGGGALVAVLLASVALGAAKGRYILSKTSQRNLARLRALGGPRRPIHVYSLRSWLVIGLTVGLSLALTLFGASPLWRGGINLAVGVALLASSWNYLKPEVRSQETEVRIRAN